MARRKNGHKPEPRKERPRIFLCAEHKRRLEELYYLDEVNAELEEDERADEGIGPYRPGGGSEEQAVEDAGPYRPGGGNEERGWCFGCMRETWGREYAFEPRGVRYRAARSGGGEREKAGRGA